MFEVAKVATMWIAVLCAILSWKVGIDALLSQESGIIPRNEEGKYEYKEVVRLPDLSADAIYKRALQWVHREYKNPKQTLQLQDAANHRLMLRHQIRVPRIRKSGSPWLFVHYKLSIEVKDGRYRYRVFKLHLKNGNRFYPIERWTDKNELPPKEAQTYLAYVDREVRSLLERMKKYIADPPVEKSDDW